jgi:hypothetical protein
MLYRSISIDCINDGDAHCRWASSSKTRRSAWESDLGADHIRRLLLHRGLGARREDAVRTGARRPATANNGNCDVGGRQQRHCQETNLNERETSRLSDWRYVDRLCMSLHRRLQCSKLVGGPPNTALWFSRTTPHHFCRIDRI